jgi:pyruvate carboxylase
VVIAKVLVANRGEAAVRIIRAARELGLATAAVAAQDDTVSLHASIADTTMRLPGAGPRAYLDQDELLKAAIATGCDAVHPGYGFLSEDASFARSCANRGLTFVGPRWELLDLYGDKVRAREAARSAGIPVVPATADHTTLAEAQAFLAAHGPVMVKAVHGGGGRGMRVALDGEQLEQVWQACAREAQLAFGDGSLYVERLITSARHVEVQICADGRAVTHLWERDCTLQRRHQKLIEIAPSPFLSSTARDQVISAALELAERASFIGLGTFEFLVSTDGYWFIETNPRLQVEHTVTEQVTGVDLVQVQLHLAGGASLAEVGLNTAPLLHGCAIESRVCLESVDHQGHVHAQAGSLELWRVPGGPGVRVDTHAYQGMATNTRYDSLVAKLICQGADFQAATTRTSRALTEFLILGVPSNVSLLRAVVGRPEFADGNYDTTFISTHLPELVGTAATLSPASPGSSGPASPESGQSLGNQNPVSALGCPTIDAPIQGVVAELRIQEGSTIRAGTTVAVIEAMKMEHLVIAARDGTVGRLLVQEGSLVPEGAPLLTMAEYEDGCSSSGVTARAAFSLLTGLQ